MPKATILVIDDHPGNIKILIEILGDQYQVLAATSGQKALELAAKARPQLILLDVQMPEMDGFEVCRRLKEDGRTVSIPVIFVTALNETSNEAKGLGLGAVDYLRKPVIPELVLARVKNHLELDAYKKRLETMVDEQTKHLMELNDEIENTLLETLQTLGEIAEIRSKETGHHVKRVTEYAYLLARLKGLDDHDCELVRLASAMHDIGKMAIPDSILKKQGRLEKEEYEEMQRHTEYGHKILLGSEREVFQESAIVAFTHHEKWNGKGYPNGLKGESIPLFGRIVALADVFDALGSDRCYKSEWHVDDVLTLLKEERGEHFDPELIDLFFANLDQFMEIRDSYIDAHQEENV